MLKRGASLSFVPLYLGILALAGVLVYLNAIDSPFQFDDHDYIVNNPLVVRPGMLFMDGDGAGLSQNVSISRWSRLMGYVTFRADYMLHGLDARGFHASNLALHISNSVLVYLLSVITLRTASLRQSDSPRGPRLAGLFAALLFVVHPVQTGAVTYVTQRFTLLAALFYLASLLLYVLHRRGAGGMWGRLAYPASLISAALAMASKEIAFTLPFAMALYETVFLEGRPRRRAALIAPFFLIALMVPIELHYSSGAAYSYNVLLPRWKYALLESRVLLTYLRLLAFPVNQNLDYDYFSHSWTFLVQLFLSPAAVLGAASASACLFLKSRRVKPWTRMAAFGVFWYLVANAVESSFVPLGDVIFEHRAYLPSVSLFMALSYVAYRFFGGLSFRGKVVLVVASVAAVVLFSAAAFDRNLLWQSESAMWEDVVSKSPRKARAHNQLGVAYMDEGRLPLAAEQFGAALRLDPGYVDSRFNLALAYERLGLTGEAQKELENVLGMSPGDEEAARVLDRIRTGR